MGIPMKARGIFYLLLLLQISQLRSHSSITFQRDVINNFILNKTWVSMLGPLQSEVIFSLQVDRPITGKGL